MTDNTEERDVNDAFDDIVFSEERIIKEGYQEGLIKGIKEGNTAGYHLGYHRGAEIGAELGYYLGIAESFLCSEDKPHEKVLKNLKKLVELINNFPQGNSKDFDIIYEADKIRTLYKKVCAQLKIDAFYPEVDNLSF